MSRACSGMTRISARRHRHKGCSGRSPPGATPPSGICRGTHPIRLVHYLRLHLHPRLVRCTGSCIVGALSTHMRTLHTCMRGMPSPHTCALSTHACAVCPLPTHAHSPHMHAQYALSPHMRTLHTCMRGMPSPHTCALSAHACAVCPLPTHTHAHTLPEAMPSPRGHTAAPAPLLWRHCSHHRQRTCVHACTPRAPLCPRWPVRRSSRLLMLRVALSCRLGLQRQLAVHRPRGGRARWQGPANHGCHRSLAAPGVGNGARLQLR